MTETSDGSQALEAPWAYEALTPADFLRRTALVHPGRLAVVDGEWRATYGELYERCRRAAASIGRLAGGRPVALLAPNSHVLLEAHFAVPWSGSPLVALNIRLDPAELGWIVGHSESSVLVYDSEYADTAETIAKRNPDLQLVRVGGDFDQYEDLVTNGSATTVAVTDERSLLAINYTSGTTGRPKGVMYHHRGAYLQALAMVFHAELRLSDAYLWTLPMFHCNGWCFPWAVTAVGATHVCQRKFDPDEFWRLVDVEGITVFCAAPTVLTMLGHAPSAHPVAERLRVMTGGAPPAPSLIERMENLGIHVTHLYGLTETFGPVVVCEWQPGWPDLALADRAVLIARQGVGNVIARSPRVVDATGADVPCDGETMGEIAVRGNDVMLGYLKDPAATAAAIPDGWFRTGDVAVMHPDGYLEIRDRSKDVIISGGENVSSVQVEAVLASHPDVLECAVVAVPEHRWGEVPFAFVTPVPGATITADELIGWARDRLAHFKVPKGVVFDDLPKTSTGKVQKVLLRDRARVECPDSEGRT